MKNIDRPKPAIVFRPNPYRDTSVPDQEFVPVEPLLLRDLNARETVGLIRFILFMAIAVMVFFIAVFGTLGAIAHAIGSGLGLHKNYPDIVGTH
jgi:hypothetical protein